MNAHDSAPFANGELSRSMQMRHETEDSVWSMESFGRHERTFVDVMRCYGQGASGWSPARRTLLLHYGPRNLETLSRCFELYLPYAFRHACRPLVFRQPHSPAMSRDEMALLCGVAVSGSLTPPASPESVMKEMMTPAALPELRSRALALASSYASCGIYLQMPDG